MPDSPPAHRLPKPFWIYLSGLSGMALGDALLTIAMPFLALGLTTLPDERAIGLVFLAGILPRFLAPVLGTLADRLQPRRALQAVSVLRTLGVGGVGLLAHLGLLPYWGLLTLAAVNALLNTLFFTVDSALLPRLVPDRLLGRANALNSGVMMGLPILGLGLGGALLGILDAAGVYLLAAPLFLAVALSTLFLPALSALNPVKGGEGQLSAFWWDLLQGLSLITRQPLLVYSAVFSWAINLMLPIINTRAPLALATPADKSGFVIFELALSGALLIGLTLAGRQETAQGHHRSIGWGSVLMAVAPLALTQKAAALWWLGSALLGVGVGLFNVAAVTRSQQLVAPEQRGRLMGTLIGLNAIGAALGAVLGASPVPNLPLMAGLSLGLGLILLGWPLTLQKQAGRNSTFREGAGHQ